MQRMVVGQIKDKVNQDGGKDRTLGKDHLTQKDVPARDAVVIGKFDGKDIIHLAQLEIGECSNEGDTYDEVIEKNPALAKEIIWTEIEEDGLEDGKPVRIKHMATMTEWETKGRPKHGPWYPKHVWMGIDPGLDEQKAISL